MYRHSNKPFYSPIVAPQNPTAQGFLGKTQQGDRVIPSPIDFEKLNTLIFHRYLTECLELLEQWGFWGESALYFIKFTQCGGEV